MSKSQTDSKSSVYPVFRMLLAMAFIVRSNGFSQSETCSSDAVGSLLLPNKITCQSISQSMIRRPIAKSIK